MASVRKVLLAVLIGAVLGAVVGTLIGRGFIPWYNSPGDQTASPQQLCNLPVVIRATIDSLVKAQLIGGAVGAALFLVGGIVIVTTMAKRAPKPATTPTNP